MKFLKNWFWTSPREGENWAQTLVRVLGNLLRSLVSVAVILVGVVLVANFAIVEYLKASHPRNSVTATILPSRISAGEYEPAPGCSEEYPFAVFISNRSRHALTKSVVRLNARRLGTTEERWLLPNLVVDDFVLPGRNWASCYRLGEDHISSLGTEEEYVLTAELEWNSWRLTTEYSKPESWMFEEEEHVPETFEGTIPAQ